MEWILSALLALTAWSADGVETGERQPHEFRRVTITGYDPMPQIDSGVFMVLRGVTIATADGASMKLYFIHMGGGTDDYPSVGSTCDFRTRPHRIANDQFGGGRPDGIEAELISSVDCAR